MSNVYKRRKNCTVNCALLNAVPRFGGQCFPALGSYPFVNPSVHPSLCPSVPQPIHQSILLLGTLQNKLQTSVTSLLNTYADVSSLRYGTRAWDLLLVLLRVCFFVVVNNWSDVIIKLLRANIY